MSNATNNPTALYASRLAETYALLKKIEDAAALHAIPDRATWGHCGSLGHVNDSLADVLAFLTGETP